LDKALRDLDKAYGEAERSFSRLAMSLVMSPNGKKSSSRHSQLQHRMKVAAASSDAAINSARW
jgi:hypothetical protein